MLIAADRLLGINLQDRVDIVGLFLKKIKKSAKKESTCVLFKLQIDAFHIG